MMGLSLRLLIIFIARVYFESQDYDRTIEFINDLFLKDVKEPLLNYYRGPPRLIAACSSSSNDDLHDMMQLV